MSGTSPDQVVFTQLRPQGAIMIPNNYKNKYTYRSIYYIKKAIMAGCFCWFISITFLQLLYKDTKSTEYLLIVPSFATLMLLLFLYFHYSKFIRHFSSYKNFFSLSRPANIYALYLLYSALTLGLLISSPEDFIYGYGYLLSYIVAYVNVLFIYSFLNYYPEMLSVNYGENTICLIGYYAAIVVLLSIAYVGIDNLLSSQRFKSIILTPGAMGLITLPIIFYPISFKWNLTRSIFFLFAIFMLLKGDSRSAMLGAFMGAAVIYSIKHPRYLILTIIFSGIIIFFYMKSDAYNLLDNILLLSNKYRGLSGELSNRLPIWETCWNIILNHPFVGVGFRMSDKVLELQSISSAHNVYLMMLMESGIIGFTLILLSIIFCWINLFKRAVKYKEKSSLFYIGLLSGALFFGIGERFLINVGNLSSILLFFALFHAHKKMEINEKILTK